MKYLIKNKDKAYQEWLESIESKSYQKACGDVFLRFLKFLEEEGFKNPTADSILKQHRENRKSDDNRVKYQFDDLIPRFSQWLLEKRLATQDSAINLTIPVKGFFKFHKEPLKVQISGLYASPNSLFLLGIIA